jgi:1-aminocyclopropane-1-carboxylate deaminase
MLKQVQHTKRRQPLFYWYFCNMEIVTQNIPIAGKNITLCIRREDLIDPFVSGNKYRKLKYNLLQAKVENHTRLLTFGGAFSNHIAAVAAAGNRDGFETVGIIRGDELSTAISANPTLSFARDCGMQFKFVSRETYKDKDNLRFISELNAQFGPFYPIPEGGTNALAVQGCEEILTEADFDFDYICCAAGTGGTAAGIINASGNHQTVLVFPALKGDFVGNAIAKFASKQNWRPVLGYDFGGYAKVNQELIAFINRFYTATKIPLDPVYTGKMIFGVMELIAKDYFADGSKILVIHTGGLQGIKGMNNQLKNKNYPLIEIDV